MREIRSWLQAHRALTIVLALVMVVGISAVLVERHSFVYYRSHNVEVSSTASEFRLDIAKGQVLKLKVRPFEASDRDEDFVVVIRQATRTDSGTWTTGYILKDCPKVSCDEFIRFRAPHSGSYEIAVKTRSGRSVDVTLLYFVGDWGESMAAIWRFVTQ